MCYGCSGSYHSVYRICCRRLGSGSNMVQDDWRGQRKSTLAHQNRTLHATYQKWCASFLIISMIDFDATVQVPYNFCKLMGFIKYRSPILPLTFTTGYFYFLTQLMSPLTSWASLRWLVRVHSSSTSTSRMFLLPYPWTGTQWRLAEYPLCLSHDSSLIYDQYICLIKNMKV